MAQQNWLTGLAVGLGIGGLAGWWGHGVGEAGAPASIDPVRNGAAPEPEDEASIELSAVDVRLPGDPGSARHAAPEHSAAREALETDDGGDGLFSAALLAHAEKELIKAWSRTRSDQPEPAVLEEGSSLFQEKTLALPAEIGAGLAERKSAAELAAEDARTGGVFQVLSRIDEGSPGPLFEVVDSAKVFDQFFQTEAGGPTLAGETAVGTREPVPDGSTLAFPAGVFTLNDLGSRWRGHFPRDLTIRGAGKDATLLVLRTDLSAYDTVRNLTLENCTIHCRNNYLFDIREPAMSITVRRCRLTGWTTGAGSSCLFGTEALALRVIDSEITGAYNKDPRWGQLFDVRRDGLLARFENCTIESCAAFSGTRAGATLVFVNCTMIDISDYKKEVPRHVRLLGTQVNWFEGEDRDVLKRDFNDLFPNWEAELRR